RAPRSCAGARARRRRLRADVHCPTPLGLGRPFRDRDALPAPWRAARGADALVVLPGGARERAASLARELRRGGWALLRRRARGGVPALLRPALPRGPRPPA